MNDRLFLCTFVSALATICASPTYAALRVDCPVRWDFMPRMGGPDLDADLYGVKVRDWKLEYLDELLLRQDECLARRNIPESVKSAERADGRRRYENAKLNHFPRRDKALQEEARRSQIATTVSESKLNQVGLDHSGAPTSIEIRGNDDPNNKVTHKCDTLRRGIGFASTESYRQVAAFARLCQQAGKTDASVVSMLERQASNIDSLHRLIAGFAASVNEEEKRQPVAISRANDLTATRNQISTLIKGLAISYPSEKFEEAKRRLAMIQAKISATACDSMYTQAGMPKAWKGNFILLGQGGVERFQPIVCDAINSGAQVRYLSGGLMSGEGFEIKSVKRTVQIFVESNRVPGGDPGVQLMNPVSAKIDGKKMALGGHGIYALIAELAAVVKNQ